MNDVLNQDHQPEELRRVRVDMGTLDRHKQQFVEFLEAEDGPANYKDSIAHTLSKKGRRVVVNLNDLREFDVELARRVITSPLEYLLALETAVKEVAQRLDPSFGKLLSQHDQLKVGFDGAFGRNHVSPRGLTSRVGGREGERDDVSQRDVCALHRC
ncbi:dna replication licensing factor mcm3 [Nannochloropsis gaditana]|uniref:Dna replication licensing factor mcm3 n=1 Tax=Nannochloropsis gaditana TaxID=72520 RepID=W7U2W6_9STRA|nr:dna replication licensing factor mcm3 [Nannochloropsis gaditana]